MEDIIKCGVDVIQPIDPSCLDIVEFKQMYGDQVCMVGNVSNELLAKVAPGGGYCVGSGNSVPDWAQFKNYMAMRDTTLKFGGYPIQID